MIGNKKYQKLSKMVDQVKDPEAKAKLQNMLEAARKDKYSKSEFAVDGFGVVVGTATAAANGVLIGSAFTGTNEKKTLFFTVPMCLCGGFLTFMSGRSIKQGLEHNRQLRKELSEELHETTSEDTAVVDNAQ